MIQRIQTLYLVLGAAALVALPFADIVQMVSSQIAVAVYAATGIAVVLALVSVFLFRERRKQRKLVVVVQVVTILLLGLLFGSLYISGILSVRTPEGLDYGRLVGLLLPLAAYVLFFLARRAVTKDIELVQSMDRLR